MTLRISIGLTLALALCSASILSAKTISCNLLEVQGQEIRIGCGLDKGISVGDKGVISYAIRVGNQQKAISPASFIVVEIYPNYCVGRIERATGEIKLSYSAQIEATGAASSTKTREVPRPTPSPPTKDMMVEALAILNRANDLYNIGKLEEARAEYEKLLQDVPDDPLAISRIRAIDKAIADRERTQSDLRSYHSAMNSALEDGQLEMARESAESALKLEPSDVLATQGLRLVEQKMRSYVFLSHLPRIQAPLGTLSTVDLKRIRAGEPPELAFYRSAMNSALQSGDLELARDYAGQILRLKPDDEVARQGLRRAQQRMAAMVYLDPLPRIHPPMAVLSKLDLAALQAPQPARMAEARQPTPPAPAPRAEAEMKIPSSPPEFPMILVRSAEFRMGEDGRQARYLNEMPTHTVQISDFFIDKYEVTQSQYSIFVKTEHHPPPPGWTNGSFPAGQETFPVTMVTWDDAVAYCRFVHKRLPTEAEWEYTARGPVRNNYPWGNRFERGDTNTQESGRGKPASVFDMPKDLSQFGVVGLAGNVSEWTADWYDAYPGNNSRELQYGEKFKIVRGGSFLSKSDFARSSFRGFRKPNSPAEDIGFRCARTASAAPAN